MRLMARLFIAAILAGCAHAQEESRTLFSETGRYVASAKRPEDAMTLLRWAEDVTSRFERFTGWSVPFERDQPIVIRLLQPLAGTPPRVDSTQGYFDGRIQQRFVLPAGSNFDQEDALEMLCRLLLNRILTLQIDATNRTRTGAIAPDWMSIGIAQNLYREARERNRTRARDAQKTGRLPAASEIASWIILPPGRMDEKYVAGVFVDWIITGMPLDRAELSDALLPRGLVQHYLGARCTGGAVAADKAWTQWVERGDRVMTDPGEEALQLLQRLVDWRTLPVAELMPVPDGWTDRVSKAWLVEHAGEAEVVELVRRAILQASSWPSAGDPLPDQAHRDFLHLLQGIGGDDGKTVRTRDLSRRVEASEQSLQRAIEQAEQRDRYLAALEVLREEPSEVLTSEQRAYLDRIEQRMREQVPAE